MTLTQLHPARAQFGVEEAVGGLGLAELAPEDRPYLVINMVSTADGKITIEGRAGPISNATDQALLYGLRSQADAVMVGAGTARIERYGDLLPGRPSPPAVIVSAGLHIPSDLPLLQEEGARVMILTASAGELPGSRARVEYLRGEAAHGELSLAPLFGVLRRDLGLRAVVCEGGPTLNSALLRQGLADELWLAVAPKLAGGSGALTAVAGAPLAEPVRLEPLRVLEEDSYLYIRYRVLRDAAAA